MSLLVIVAVIVAYLCVVAFAVSLLAAAKQADTAMEDAYRRHRLRRPPPADREGAGEEERPAEMAGRRRGG
jgi:hypothetical protein